MMGMVSEGAFQGHRTRIRWTRYSQLSHRHQINTRLEESTDSQSSGWDEHELCTREDCVEDEEEEEHLAPADSTTVIPADEPVFPPEGTEPVIPPPSTDITIGARITVRP
ncbi:hypothetical protein Tco_0794150 [Tanacetum coccineum]